MIDIIGLIKEFKDRDIEVSMLVNSDYEYIFSIAMDDLSKEELKIIDKYANIECIKISENAREFEIYLSVPEA